MAKTAKDYAVTTPYGAVKGYPLNPIANKPGYGFHNGIDYGAPETTPIVVNGVTIGYVGHTGYVYDNEGNNTVKAAHLHVGRWISGTVTNPGIGGGFTFKSAKVTEVNQDSVNGKYVRVQGDGASWVYLHLSSVKVRVGQVLKGAPVNNTKPVSYYRANQISHAVLCRGMTEAEFNKYHKGKTELQLFEAFRKSAEHKRAEALVQKG